MPSSCEPGASRPSRRFGIELAETVSWLNLFVFLCVAGISITFYVFINSAQAFVLSDILGIVDSAGDISGSLAFYDQLLTIPAVFLWGLLSDKIGRRWVYFVGFLLMGAGLAIYPFATSVYPSMLLYRILFAMGASATSAMLTAVLGDFISGDGRGKVSGVLGLATGAGALFGVFVLLRLPPTFSARTSSLATGIRTTYFLVAGLAVGAAVLVIIGLGSFRVKRERPMGLKDLIAQAKRGFLAAKNLHIALAFAGSFVARGDSTIVTLFLPLWVNQYYINQGLCPVGDAHDEDAIKSSCAEAYRMASTLSGVAQTLALVGALMFGLFGELRRFSPSISLLFASVLGTVGYLATGMMADPTSPIAYLLMVLVGLSEIGMIVSSLHLVSGSADSEARGAVAGVYSLFGAAGILLTTRLGGYLFDSWMAGAPFVIMGVCHGVVCVFAIFIFALDHVFPSTGLGRIPEVCPASFANVKYGSLDCPPAKAHEVRDELSCPERRALPETERQALCPVQSAGNDNSESNDPMSNFEVESISGSEGRASEADLRPLSAI